VAAGQRVAAGTPGAAAIREVVDAALTLLPPDDPEDAPIDG
jgi:hypothetical protein